MNMPIKRIFISRFKLKQNFKMNNKNRKKIQVKRQRISNTSKG